MTEHAADSTTHPVAEPTITAHPEKQGVIELIPNETPAGKTQWNWAFFSANGHPLATNITPFKRRNDAHRAATKLQEEFANARIVIATTSETNEEQ